MTKQQMQTCVGAIIDCGPRLGRCKVLVIRDAGTIDVMASDGRCYRISGLAFT